METEVQILYALIVPGEFMPQPIETAPKDGTTILTDCGFANWQTTWKRWVECDPNGYVYDCADNGPWECNPLVWEPVPEWVLEDYRRKK